MTLTAQEPAGISAERRALETSVMRFLGDLWKARADTALAALRREEPRFLASAGALRRAVSASTPSTESVRALVASACIAGWLGEPLAADSTYGTAMRAAALLRPLDRALTAEVALNHLSLWRGLGYERSSLAQRRLPSVERPHMRNLALDSALINRRIAALQRQAERARLAAGLAGEDDNNPEGRASECGTTAPMFDELLWARRAFDYAYRVADSARTVHAWRRLRVAGDSARYWETALRLLARVGAPESESLMAQLPEGDEQLGAARFTRAMTVRNYQHAMGEYSDQRGTSGDVDWSRRKLHVPLVAVTVGPDSAWRLLSREPTGAGERADSITGVRLMRYLHDTALVHRLADEVTVEPSRQYSEVSTDDIALPLEQARMVYRWFPLKAAQLLDQGGERAERWMAGQLSPSGTARTIRSGGVESRLDQATLMRRLAGTDTAYGQWLNGALTLAASVPHDTAVHRIAGEMLLRHRGRVLAAGSNASAARRELPPAARARLDSMAAARREQSTALRRADTDAADVAGTRADELEDTAAREALWLQAQRLPLGSRDVQRALPADAAYVQFFRYSPDEGPSFLAARWKPQRYGALVLRSGRAAVIHDLGVAAGIDSLAITWAKSLRTRGAGASEGKMLYGQVVAPLRTALRGAAHWIVVPEGSLASLPLQALPLSATRLLIDSVLVSYAASAADVVRRPTESPRSPSVIIAAPDFFLSFGQSATARSRVQWDSLPGTRTEAKRVAAYLPGARLLLGASATKSAVLALRAPQVLHVATHGFFSGDARSEVLGETRGATADEVAVPKGATGSALSAMANSGLVFAGANATPDASETILTALEAQSLDLSGTALVVLSACESGLGTVAAGEGVIGLQRALQLAGAQSLAVSLWQVPDAETAELMVAFHEALASGAGRAAALRDAQLQFRRRHPDAPSFFWAAFVLLGRWEPIGPSVPVTARATPDSAATVAGADAIADAADIEERLSRAEAGPFAARRWTVPFAALGVVPKGGAASSDMAANAGAFFVAGDAPDSSRLVVALESASGKERWRLRTGARARLHGAAGGLVFLVEPMEAPGNSGAWLVALDERTGTRLWRLRVERSAADLSFVETGGVLIAARLVRVSDEREPFVEVFALRPADGRRLWTRALPWMRQASSYAPTYPTLAPGRDGVMVSLNGLTGLDPSSGVVLATGDRAITVLPDAYRRLDAVWADDSTRVSMERASDDVHAPAIVLWRTRDGVVRWRLGLGVAMSCPATNAGDWMVGRVTTGFGDARLGTDSHFLVAVNAHTGALASSSAFGSALLPDVLAEHCPAVSGNTVLTISAHTFVAVRAP